ncbi:hypothetical protein ACFWAY_47350 [Rhodococcus sp. NPDC059968]
MDGIDEIATATPRSPTSGDIRSIRELARRQGTVVSVFRTDIASQ